MKKYYQRLDKNRKLEIKKIYNKEYAKSDFKVRLNRLMVYAVMAYVFALILLIYSLVYDTDKISNIIIAITLLVLGTIYLIGRYIAKLNVLNKIALKKK